MTALASTAQEFAPDQTQIEPTRERPRLTLTEGDPFSSEFNADNAERFIGYLKRLQEQLTPEEAAEVGDLIALAEAITPGTPIVYWTMEFYDEKNGFKGGGGLGVLAADIRRVAEELGIPLIIVTPFYRNESHQDFNGAAWQTEILKHPQPERTLRHIGSTAISTQIEGQGVVPTYLDVYDKVLGSTHIVSITEKHFGELYQDGNNSMHRLYQEAALGFGGYHFLAKNGIEAPVMPLNEAPTVFAAIARLDDLVSQGISLEQALAEVKSHMLYINHTLVQAVESEFEFDQFEDKIMPNISSDAVKNWVRGMFSDGKLKLSSVVMELSDTKGGVSKKHTEVADFKDRNGNPVKFEKLTNGISLTEWVFPETLAYLRELGALDEYDLPTPDHRERLESLDANKVRLLKQQGRQYMNEVLAGREDWKGNPVQVPEDALVYFFNRRIAGYKRPGLPFSDPDRLVDILEGNNAYYLMSGKVHPRDEDMKRELQRILKLVDENPRLRERVFFIKDYDEEVAKALEIGGDWAINTPKVGWEASGTSPMKAMGNLDGFISTEDGFVPDANPVPCLVVSGENETEEIHSMYSRMEEAGQISADDQQYKDQIVRQLQEYLRIISGSRMLEDYVKLSSRMLRRAINISRVVETV